MLVYAAAVLSAMALAVGGTAVVRCLRTRWMAVVVRGHSMSPTLRNGDRVWARRGAEPRRGDIIVFTASRSPLPDHGLDPELRVKRVVAVGGDPVPGWLLHARSGRQRLQAVPDGYVVVRGDNVHSQDSRQLGFIPLTALVGVVSPRFARQEI